MLVVAHEFGSRFHHAGLVHPWLGLLFWVFFAALIGVAVWLFVRTTNAARLGPVVGPPSDPAMEMLRSRFARGEIDTNEFAARAAYLSGQPAPSTGTSEGPAPASGEAPTTPDESADESDGQ
jgi:uncharacterized membrane protein